MIDAQLNAQHVGQAVDRMLRIAEHDHGLSIRQLSAETGIPASTLGTYRVTGGRAQAAMPLSTFVALCRVLPDELTSLVLDMADKRVAPLDADPGAWLGVAAEASGLASDICEAKADGKITPIEHSRLKHRARRLTAKLVGAAGA